MLKPLSRMAAAALCAALMLPVSGFATELRFSVTTEADAPRAPAVTSAAMSAWEHDAAPETGPRREVTFAERVEQSRRRTADRMARTEREVPIRVGGVAAEVVARVDYQVGRLPGPNGRSYRADALECLSEALYFESRGEGTKGQTAVAEVILNRVDSAKFPNTVCGVVRQSNRRGCQFSYVCDGLSKKIREPRAYARVQAVARRMLAGEARDLTSGATYFHTPAVRPSWSHRFVRTARIGRHIFYRTGRRMAAN